MNDRGLVGGHQMDLGTGGGIDFGRSAASRSPPDTARCPKGLAAQSG